MFVTVQADAWSIPVYVCPDYMIYRDITLLPPPNLQGTDPGSLDYAMNRAIDAWYNDRAWFHALQKRVMEQVKPAGGSYGVDFGGGGDLNVTCRGLRAIITALLAA